MHRHLLDNTIRVDAVPADRSAPLPRRLARALGPVILVSLTVPIQATSPWRLQAGDPMPPVTGSLLTGQRATLPAASAGRTTLILMGFTYESRHPVEAWGNWFRAATAGRSGVTFFEVPMIGGMARLGRWFIDRGMRKGTPEALHGNVLTVYGDTGAWKERLGVTDVNKDDAFLILLDRNGVIQWQYQGAFDAGTAETLQGLLISLSGPINGDGD